MTELTLWQGIFLRRFEDGEWRARKGSHIEQEMIDIGLVEGKQDLGGSCVRITPAGREYLSSRTGDE